MSQAENPNPEHAENLTQEATAKEGVDVTVDDSPESAPEALTSDESTIEHLQAELEAAQKKAEENWDTVLRLKADMENQRRRSEKQVEDAHKFAVQKFVEALLPVADSLEMGMSAEGDIEKIREGIGLTMNVLNSVMEKFAVVAVDPLGEKFNPELHQAMAMQPSEDYDDGHVSAVMQKGYTLNGRLVRPAMVMVAQNS